MKLSEIKRSIQRFFPVNADCLLESCGFSLRFLGDGAFRNVYEIIGSGYVVKVPLNQSEMFIDHAISEYKTFKRFKNNKRYKKLHPYLPDEMYLHKRTGVVVMTQYGTPSYRCNRKMDAISKLVQEITGLHGDRDISSEKWDNWGIDSKGQLRIIDLAYLEYTGTTTVATSEKQGG